MPYVLWKKNGKRASTPFIFTATEADNLARDEKNCYTLINTTTRRTRRVGGSCRPRRRR